MDDGLGGVGEHGAASCPDDRALRRGQRLRRHADALVASRLAVVYLWLVEVDVGLLLEGVRGDLYLDGARPSGGHLAEGLVYGVRQVRGFEDALGPLCDGSDGVDLVVDLVEGAEVLSDMFPVDLAGYEEHGGRGGVCGADAGGGVEQAGAGHYESCAEAAGRPWSSRRPCRRSPARGGWR